MYKRDVITDALHKACGFRTDFQFITRSKMRTIQKKANVKNKLLDFETMTKTAVPLVNTRDSAVLFLFNCQRWDFICQTLSLYSSSTYLTNSSVRISSNRFSRSRFFRISTLITAPGTLSGPLPFVISRVSTLTLSSRIFCRNRLTFLLESNSMYRSKTFA